MKVPVWVYWEGPAPEYIRLCLATIREACARDDRCEFRLVNKATYRQWIPAPHPTDAWFGIAEQGIASDCVRAALLERYGGVYLDADTICLKSPASLWDPSSLRYCVWATKTPWRAVAGYLAAPASHPSCSLWVAKQAQLLACGKVGWMSLGEVPLTEAIGKHQQSCSVFERRLVLPIDIDSQVEAFFRPGDWRDYVLPETVAFGLNHSYMVSRHRGAMLTSRTGWRLSSLLIHRLLADLAEMVHFNG